MFFFRLGFYSFFDPLKAREGTPGRFHFLTNGTVRRGGALKGEKNAPFCLVLSIFLPIQFRQAWFASRPTASSKSVPSVERFYFSFRISS